MPMMIVRNDITKIQVDAVVNAANTALKMGGGVCGAIFSAAGAEGLQAECEKIGGCKVGEAVITKGGNLPAKYIIHAVGPIWQGGKSGEEKLLHNCYINSMKLAFEKDLKSIAFPLISSGIYGYPKDKALQAAMSAIGEFLLHHELMVYLVVYDKKAFILSEKLFSSIERFIDDNYVEEHSLSDGRRGLEDYELQEPYNPQEVHLCSKSMICDREYMEGPSLVDILNKLEETFSQMLIRLIDEKGMKDVEVYKRANVDRRLFSKIKNNRDYNPSKITAVAFAIALGLNMDETRTLLSRAGYTLSHSSKFDIIIEFFIEEGNYNIYEINEVLFQYDQALLGA